MLLTRFLLLIVLAGLLARVTDYLFAVCSREGRGSEYWDNPSGWRSFRRRKNTTQSASMPVSERRATSRTQSAQRHHGRAWTLKGFTNDGLPGDNSTTGYSTTPTETRQIDEASANVSFKCKEHSPIRNLADCLHPQN